MNAKAHQKLILGCVYVTLIVLSVTMLLPFVWMVLASFKPLQEVESSSVIPKDWRPENYLEVFKQVAFARYYANSVFIASWITLLTLLTSAMAAFAFARMQWTGRDHVFRLYLATLMIPGVVTMIPNYTVMVQLRLLDSFTGLIVPASFSAFGTFLLRQFMISIPAALDEAATLDGATPWGVFWDVVLPLARPGLIALGIFTFVGNYGSFFWPLIITKSENLRTLPIGLMFFDSAYGKQTNLIMAASVMSVIPPALIFIFLQKHLVRGIQLGAVKG